LALASILVSFSNLQAAYFFAPSDETTTINNDVSNSGIIRINERGIIVFQNSSLGTAESGRYEINCSSVGGCELRALSNTTMYIGFVNSLYMNMTISGNSSIFFDNNVYSPDYVITVVNNSTLKAPSVLAKNIYLMSNAQAEFAANVSATMSVNYSTWTSLGTSNIATLNIDHGAIELLMGSATDAIYADKINASAGSSIVHNFTNDFIDTIMSGDGYFDLNTENTIVSSNINGTIDMSVANTNGTYVWTVTDHGDGVNFRVSDFALIPEPSTYAVIFGALALGLAIYRRRK